MLDEIEYYLNNILYKTLDEYGVKKEYIEEILQSIRIRMYSMIKNWNNIKIRKALLLVTEEEGIFYEPNASKDIKCFIVATIRNSKIETIGSRNSMIMGVEKEIDNAQIKNITKNAILYFKKQNLEELSIKLRKENIDDYYLNIIKKYPISWKAIMEISNTKSKEIIFDKITEKVEIKIMESNQEVIKSETNENAIVEDGISETYNRRLLDTLDAIEKNQLDLFFCDSFKLLTRNFEKLLKTMEFILQRDKMFITCNFMILNGYVARRNELLRATHTGLDTKNKVKNIKGLPKKFADVLKDLDGQV